MKFISTGFSISVIYFAILALLYYDNNIISSVYAQQSTLSDHGLHDYLGQMKGHLDASIINVQNNNSVLAVAHALHPIEEIVDIINNRLIQTNETLSKEFTSKLNTYVETVQSDQLNILFLKKWLLQC
ncbi:MAG TPA: hypothetical protein VJ697_06785 [Nitrososphaeraceae archaeon]|nr:hypothetical protein [Nitrososphaeraceae archaeon]